MDQREQMPDMGQQVRRYRKSPLIEALCEIQFEPRAPWDWTAVGLIYEQLRHDFPHRRQAKVFGVEIAPQPEEGGVRQQMTLTDRVQFVRKDETALVQVSPHFLAINHLKPYTSWEAFQPLILQAIEAYRAQADPTGIQRLGLRYFNQIEFPEQTVELQDYFFFYPQLGGDLPQVHGPFNMSVQFAYEHGRDVLQVQLTSISSISSPSALLLDLSYTLVRPGAVELEAIAEWVSGAHSRIYTTFEAIITPVLRAKFEEEPA